MLEECLSLFLCLKLPSLPSSLLNLPLTYSFKLIFPMITNITQRLSSQADVVRIVPGSLMVSITSGILYIRNIFR